MILLHILVLSYKWYRLCKQNVCRPVPFFVLYSVGGRVLNIWNPHRLIRGDFELKKNQMEILFVLGFVLGVVLPNFLWKTELEANGLPGLYLLTRVSQGMPANPEYFIYVIKTRGAVYAMCMLCGLSVFGLPVSVVASVWMGFLMGAVLTVSLLEFGVEGMFLAGILFFPQYVVYVPASLALYRRSFQLSLRCWKNQRGSAQERREYGIFCVCVGALLLVGMFLESYVNPVLIEKVMDKLHFFPGM